MRSRLRSEQRGGNLNDQIVSGDTRQCIYTAEGACRALLDLVSGEHMQHLGLRPTVMTGTQLCIVQTIIQSKGVHSIFYESMTGDWAQQSGEVYKACQLQDQYPGSQGPNDLCSKWRGGSFRRCRCRPAKFEQ